MDLSVQDWERAKLVDGLPKVGMMAELDNKTIILIDHVGKRTSSSGMREDDVVSGDPIQGSPGDTYSRWAYFDQIVELRQP